MWRSLRTQRRACGTQTHIKHTALHTHTHSQMGKSRFTTLDIAAVAATLRARAVGLRVVNVYDAPGTHKVCGWCVWVTPS